MSRIEVIGGGAPTRAQAVAILTAARAVIDDEAAVRIDPSEDRSAWRRAGILHAVGARRVQPGWGRR